MKTVEALIVLAVIGVSVVALTGMLGRAIGRRLALRRAEDAPWELVEHSDGEQVCVYAERPGEDRLLIGAAPFAAMDFDVKIRVLRAEGYERVYALNERNK